MSVNPYVFSENPSVENLESLMQDELSELYSDFDARLDELKKLIDQ